MENIEKLENQAIDAAVNFKWQEAIDLNEKIIKLDKKNLPAYLRLGFATSQNQKFTEAIKYYNKLFDANTQHDIDMANRNAGIQKNRLNIFLTQTDLPDYLWHRAEILCIRASGNVGGVFTFCIT